MIKINLSDIILALELLHPENEQRFKRFLAGKEDHWTEEYVSWRDIPRDEAGTGENDKDPLYEFQNILLPVCDRLLKHDRCILHGVAFRWKEKGLIFTAPSGTGKTTQYINWRRLYREDVRILNGDKPVLEKRGKDSFYIQPSPWRGKEGWSSMTSMKLDGIIYLEQASYNEIERLIPEQAIIPMLRAVLYSADDTELIRLAVSFIKDLIEDVPVWRLKNRGDQESSILTHDMLTEYFEGEDKWDIH